MANLFGANAQSSAPLRRVEEVLHQNTHFGDETVTHACVCVGAVWDSGPGGNVTSPPPPFPARKFATLHTLAFAPFLCVEHVADAGVM